MTKQDNLTVLPDTLKCSMCPKGTMTKHRLGLFHQYYQCNNLKCKDVIGLPLSKYDDDKVSDNDFGSGAYKSNRGEDFL
jgi:hypothetical protein